MTARQLFRTMPPTRHDRDATRSELLAHIMATSSCDLEQAKRTFHYLRKKGHLTFSKATRHWTGVEYTPQESEAVYRPRIASEMASLRARVRNLERLVSALRDANNALADHLGMK